jgi:hypothetical protein
LHTVVSGNATILSTATIRNDLLNLTNTTNNTNILTDILQFQLGHASERIRATLQPANGLLELHTDMEVVCIANDTSLGECDINIIIR